MKSKLIGIERIIAIFDFSDKLLEEVKIDIALPDLLKIIKPYPGDSLLYEAYELKYSQIKQIEALLDNKISYNLKKHHFHLICLGDYGW